MKKALPPFRAIAIGGAVACALLAICEFTVAKDAKRQPPCDVDCKSRDAGYAWAKELSITDPSECGGSSADFISGCQDYAGSHEDPMALPAESEQSDAEADAEQDKSDGFVIDDKVNVLTGPSADPDSNLPLPSEAPSQD